MSNTTTLGELLKDYEGDIEVVPAGEYQVEIVGVKPRATDVVPTFKVVAGPYAGKKTMGGVISWNGAAAPRAFARMREVGLDKAWFTSIGGNELPIAEVMKQVAEAMKGRVVNLDLSVEEPNKYHDDYRNKLEKFTALVSAPTLAPSGIPTIPQVAAPPVVANPVTAPVANPVAPVAAPIAAPVAPGVPQVAAPVAVAPVAAPVPVTEAPVAAVPVVAVAPVAEVAAAPVAAAPAAAPAPVAATIQVTDEPDF